MKHCPTTQKLLNISMRRLLVYDFPLMVLPFHCGDSSVVTRWTVDQEVVGSNPTHGGNLISVVRSLSGFTQPIR